MTQAAPTSRARLVALLESLESRGVRLWREGARLRFRAPRGGFSADEKEQLSAGRPELLELLRERAASESRLEPASYQQRALWLEHQQQPDSAAYNVAFSARVRSALPSDALATAFQTLLDRHSALRTTFEESDGVVLRRVVGWLPFSLDRVDAKGLDEDALRAQVQSRYRMPFSLAEGPLIRVSVHERAADDAVLLIVAHHIVMDGWSVGVLLDELRHLLLEQAGVTTQQLPVVERDYGEFVAWQASLLESAEGRRLESYWMDHLAAPRTVLSLPADGARAAVGTRHGASLALSIDDATVQVMRALARSEGTTLFTLLLTAFKVFLARYTGTRDVIVGTPALGRGGLDPMRVLGHFVNVLPLRSDIDPEATFVTLLQREGGVVHEALECQHLPLARIVERVNPDREPGRSPLFETVFVLQHFSAFAELDGLLASSDPSASTDFAGLALQPYPIDQQEGQFDFSLQMLDAGGVLSGAMRYDVALFQQDTVERMAAQFVHLLGAMVREPNVAVGDLSMLAAAERERILRVWNDTARAYRRDSTLHALVSDNAIRRPQAVAIDAPGASLTYAELESRAARLAGGLRAAGIRGGDRVGVGLGLGVDLIVTYLAILKCGAAYVPLDPGLPRARLALLLRQTGASIVVVPSPPNEGGAFHGFDGVRPTDIAGLLSHDPVDAQAVVVAGPLSPAYVMFTSGSTGQPKGVVVPHRAVVRLVDGNQFLPPDAFDRFLAMAPVSFDASTLELWGPLVNGGTIVLGPEGTDAIESLATWVPARRVGGMWLTAALFHDVVDHQIEALRDVRYLLAGGDVLSPAHVERARLALPGCRLINGYGPTENTTFTCCHEIGDEAWGRALPIGRPISNTSVYILDRRLQPVPVGVTGQLFAGGDGLALEYLGDPDLTRERFIIAPFPIGGDERLYATGDMARFRADGCIEFLGRSDLQVKLRGHRVEPGEIEVALCELAGVRQACVLVMERGASDRELVACVVSGESPVEPTELRGALAARLPAYMVPSRIVVIERLPITANGKVDRKQLAETVRSIEPVHALADPVGPVEAAIAAVWREVLETDGIGRDSDFFQVGGHSLLAARVCARLRERFSPSPRLAELLRNPVLRDFARGLQHRWQATSTETPLVARDPDAPRALSGTQRRLWLMHEFFPGSTAYHIPFALSLDGALDVSALRVALDALASRHEILRSVYVRDQGTVVQRPLPPATLPLELRDLRGEVDADAAAIAFAEAFARRPFALDKEPSCRALLVQVSEQRSLLVLCLHHISCDQWSIGLLCDELCDFYAAASQGRLEAPPRPLQFSDLPPRSDSAQEEEGLAHWVAALTGLRPLALPLDRERPQTFGYRGRTLVLPLSADLASRLEAEARRNSTTPFVIGLAAYLVLLHQATGQDDVAVAVPFANRPTLATEGVVGPLLNTLVIRSRLEPLSSCAEFIARVAGSVLDAFTHADVPFERVVESLRPERDLSRPALVQAFFNFPNAARGLPSLWNLRTRVLPVEREGAQFELSFSLDLSITGGLVVEYSTDLFDSATPRRLAEHYLSLVDALVAQPERSVSALKRWRTLDDTTWRRVVEDFNATAVTADDLPFIRRFLSDAARRSGRVALAQGATIVDYPSLALQVRHLATALREAGAGRGTVVAVCLERDLLLPAVLLAIQSSGAAYLPLDPSHPAERIGYMLQDSGATLLVVDSKTAGRLPLPASIRAIDAATLRERTTVTDEPADLDDSGPAPDDAAYIMYTSGSTGRPKGVVISHRSLGNFLASMARAPGVADTDVLAAVTTVSFDISGLELYLPLRVGARIELLGRASVQDGASLVRALTACSATVLQATPATWRLLVAAGWKAPPGFRALCGGEAMPPELATALLKAGARLWNLYGPTETTIWSTLHEVTEIQADVPVGRPIDNTRIYVVDPIGRPRPVGVAGEIWIGGDGVASGYHRRPELTAEKFLPDPFVDVEGARVYRTGDLGRWDEQGRLHHLGRIDRQVKIRGFRIEVGEIEVALSGHESVGQVVVLAREAAAGDQRLVAYVKFTGPELTASEVRRHLRDTLPDYMIPSVVVTVERFQTTPNGKVDVAALPDPFRHTGRGVAQVDGPVTDMERTLVSIWQDVLKVGAVGVNDNFFDLGGHSLLTIQVVSEVEARTGWRMEARSLFFSSLRQLAALGTGELCKPVGESA